VTTRHRLTIAAIVVLVTAAIGMWLSTNGAARDSAAPAGTPHRPTSDLVAARAEAALRRCPTPAPGSTGRGPLTGVHATCLGNGMTVDLGAAVADRTVLIHVWSPRYDACRRELAVLDNYSTSATAVPVIGIQAHGDAVEGLRLLADLSVRLPSVRDDDGRVSDVLRPPTDRPASYVLTPDGNVHRVEPTVPFASTEQIQAAVHHYVVGGL
jgi:hypothetical protein